MVSFVLHVAFCFVPNVRMEQSEKHTMLLLRVEGVRWSVTVGEIGNFSFFLCDGKRSEEGNSKGKFVMKN